MLPSVLNFMHYRFHCHYCNPPRLDMSYSVAARHMWECHKVSLTVSL